MRINPFSCDAYTNLSSLAIAENEFTSALDLANKAIKLNPNCDVANLNAGKALLELGDLEQALASTLKSLELQPDNHTAHMNLGSIYQDLGELDQALTSTIKYLELKPDNPDALMNLGGIYKDLGQLDQALASTLKNLEIKPDNPTAHMNLGVIYKDLGNLDQALTSTLKSLELQPDNHTAHMNLGSIYQDLGNLDQALTSTLKSLELKRDNPDALTNLGSIYQDLGNLDQALTSTLKSLELKPNNPDALTNLGGIYQDLGELDQALASTLQSLELKHDNPDAHMNLGNIYYARSDYTNSEKEFDLAINLNNSISDICHRGKAACLFRKEEYNEAIWLLKKLSLESAFTGKSLWETQTALKATVHAKKQKLIRTQRMSIATSPKEEEERESLVIIKNRPVKEDLISELYRIKSKKLSEVKDARNGNGLCTDFQLFNNKLPAIQQLSKDLKAIASKELSKEICSLKYSDSFFNIFNSNAGTTPHGHVGEEDKRFNLWQHKYSLVYYIDPGDQNCENPGILRLHNPDIEILPEKGMLVIIPATRMHSSYYEGTKSRLMVGINFYAFTCDQG